MRTEIKSSGGAIFWVTVSWPHTTTFKVAVAVLAVAAHPDDPVH